MSLLSGQTITKVFTTRNFSTGAAANADSLPTGTLYINGTANAATVTVTNITTGVYKAAVTLPALSPGDVVELAISATVSAVADNAVVYTDSCDASAIVHSGTAQAGGSQTITLASTASATNNIYGGSIVLLYGGTGAGQCRVCQNYNGNTKVLNVDNTWTTQPDATSQYAILAYHSPATDGGQNVVIGASYIASIATSVLTTQMTEAYAVNGVAPTLAQAVFALQQGFLEMSIAGTTLTVKKLDRVTPAMTFTLDSATAPSSRTRAT